MPGQPDQNILKLIEGAHLLIYDSSYTDEEFPRYETWGHSTWQEGVRLCEQASVERLVVFHHDPSHDDATMDAIAAAAEEARPGTIVAKEGLVLRRDPRNDAAPRPAPRARTGFGLATVLGLARAASSSPTAMPPLPPTGEQPALSRRRAPGCAAAPAFAEVLDGMQELEPSWRRSAEPEGGQVAVRPRWDSGLVPEARAAAACMPDPAPAPARIVEVGSGHSTRFYARAISDGSLETRLQTIDPARSLQLAVPGWRWSRREHPSLSAIRGASGKPRPASIDSSHMGR